MFPVRSISSRSLISSLACGHEFNPGGAIAIPFLLSNALVQLQARTTIAAKPHPKSAWLLQRPLGSVCRFTDYGDLARPLAESGKRNVTRPLSFKNSMREAPSESTARRKRELPVLILKVKYRSFPCVPAEK
jgi:hypothetical protein